MAPLWRNTTTRTGMKRNKWRFSNALIRKYIEVFTTFPASKNKSSFHEHAKTLPSEKTPGIFTHEKSRRRTPEPVPRRVWIVLVLREPKGIQAKADSLMTGAENMLIS